MKLARLEKVDLRNQWKKEDQDFTPWLAEEENIELLSKEIGIDLEVQGQEENVGPFRADILCLDTLTNNYVLIENQLEKTDHTHLGQLMTYASGLDAVTIIWIAKTFTEEHRAALDWLNRITDDTFSFFGIEVELWKIGDSSCAPKFQLVSKPNDWSKSVKKSTANTIHSEIKIFQQQYWQALKDYLSDNNSFIKMQKALPQSWANIAIGRTDFSISSVVTTQKKQIKIWLNILGDNAKENYDRLFSMGEEKSFEEINADIVWDRMDDKKMSCVYFCLDNTDITDTDDWESQFQWFKIHLEKIMNYFKPLIKKI